MLLTSEFGYYQIELRTNDGDNYPALTDISYFLHDFNLFYEFTRVIADPKYRNYHFSRFFTYRNRRRIDEPDQLSVERLSKESPLLIIVAVAALPSAAGTIWALVQIFEKIANLGLNREILKLNRDKLRRELQEPHSGPIGVSQNGDVTFREQIHIREAEYIYERIERHLGENPIRIREIEVTYTRQLPGNGDKKK